MDKYAQILFLRNYEDLNDTQKWIVAKYKYDVEHPVWKRIVVDGFQYAYEVSNVGEVRKITGEKLPQYRNPHNGAYQVSLNSYRGGKVMSVLRLVAIMFVPNPLNKQCATHISHKSKANWVQNIQWVDRNEIVRRSIPAFREKKIGVLNPKCKYTEEQIHEICQLIDQGMRNIEIVKKLNIPPSIVSSIKNGFTWRHIAEQYNFYRELFTRDNSDENN